MRYVTIISLVALVGCRDLPTEEYIDNNISIQDAAPDNYLMDTGMDSGSDCVRRVNDEMIEVDNFEISRTEVTVSEYKECIVDGYCKEISSNETRCNINIDQRENYPMNCVTFSRAEEYCEYVGGRLPTAEEWEHAASSGDRVDYPWGNTPVDCEYAIVAMPISGCGELNSWPVCSRLDGNTVDGLCDMIGNVSEWVIDVNDNFHYKSTRGGNYTNSNPYLLMISSDSNIYQGSNYEYSNIGFRCMRTLE